jgi:hypothetical protein
MGCKGVSKRKPKKSFSNDNTNARLGESPSVQSLVNVKDAALNRGGHQSFQWLE